MARHTEYGYSSGWSSSQQWWRRRAMCETRWHGMARACILCYAYDSSRRLNPVFVIVPDNTTSCMPVELACLLPMMLVVLAVACGSSSRRSGAMAGCCARYRQVFWDSAVGGAQGGGGDDHGGDGALEAVEATGGLLRLNTIGLSRLPQATFSASRL